MKTLLSSLALSLSLASAASAFTEPAGLAALPPERVDRGYPRVALTPMVGFMHGVPGFGADLSMGLGPVAFGARASAANSLCIMCEASNGETQLSLLGGWRREFRSGSVALRSGISKVDRHTSKPSARYYGEYDFRDFDGWGVPVTVDALWGNRFVGGSVSATAMFDRDGGSFGMMVGLPLGYLHF